MAKLKATTCILFQNRLYSAGDDLPTQDAAMVSAWLEAKTAVWEDDEKKADSPGKRRGAAK